jgi:methylthioribose-1-phosphate isomerase
MYSSTGGDIEIEDRGAEEVVSVGGSEIAPRGTGVMNPAFDVTSVGLITAIVTDRRVIRLDRGETLATVSSGPTGTLRG